MSIAALAEGAGQSPEYWMTRLKAGHDEALAHLMARCERPGLAFLHRWLREDSGVVHELA